MQDKQRKTLIAWIVIFSIVLVISGGGLIYVLVNNGTIELPDSGANTQQALADNTNDDEDDEDSDDTDKEETTTSGKTDNTNTITNNTQTSVAGVRNQLCQVKGNGEDTVTVMLYFNGSNLESEYGAACRDIKEIIDAVESDKVNLVLETISTRKWKNYDIASDHTQRYLIENGGLTLVDDSLGQQDVTTPEALANFVHWAAETYPADRYMLILWDHGGGSVDGFGYNEWGKPSDALTIDEMREALDRTGVKFDFIGFDACIMSTMEICYAMYDYCDYMILSEDFESSMGWFYTNWVTALAKNTSISMEDLGKIIVDDMVEYNERRGEEEATLALIDQRYIPTLFKSWKTFAYDNEDQLLASNFSIEVERSSRAKVYDDKGTADMQDYHITDMMAVVSSIPSSSSKSVALALKDAIIYYSCTEDDAGMTGLAVALPYNDRHGYAMMKEIFSSCGFDKDYVIWLEKFIDASPDSYDYEDFEESWEGWDSVEG